MLPHPLQLQRTEKLPEYAGELEMYSVRFVLSVASRKAQDKVERQRNRSLRLGARDLHYPLPEDSPAPDSPRDGQLDSASD